MSGSPKDAENALCDMHLAAAIQAICDNSVFRSDAGKTFAMKISRMCHAQTAKQLRAYEKAGGVQ